MGLKIVMETTYLDPQFCATANINIETLGSIIFIDKNKTYGKFKSKERGYVKYDLATDTFTHLDNKEIEEILQDKETVLNPVSKLFGDTYLLLELLKKTPLFNTIQDFCTNNEDLDLFIYHLIYSVGKCGQDIEYSDYVNRSFISLLKNNAETDCPNTSLSFFNTMADFDLRKQFFVTFIEEMKKNNKDFGKVSIIDLIPLEGTIKSFVLQYLNTRDSYYDLYNVRLLLILDEATGLPVWFDFVSCCDSSLSIQDNYTFTTEEFGLEVNNLILHNDYCCEETLNEFCTGALSNFLIKLPSKKEYNLSSIFNSQFKSFNQGQYSFVLNKQVYFGKGIELSLFDQKYWGYVYINKTKAEISFTSFLEEHEEEFSHMTNNEKNKKQFEDGFFVLISPYTQENKAISPQQALSKYYEYVNIESSIKDNDNFSFIYPLMKQEPDSIVGLIFNEVIASIFSIFINKQIEDSKIDLNLPKIIAILQSLICVYRNKDIKIEIPSKKITDIMNKFGIKIPNRINITDYNTNETY